MVWLFSWAYYEYNYHTFSTLRFQNMINQKHLEAEAFGSLFTKHLQEGEEWQAIDKTYENKPEGIEVIVYKNDSLCAWSNQVLPFMHEDIAQFSQKVAKLANTWYIIKNIEYSTWKIYTLISIKTEYSFQNAFLKDNYALNIPLISCHQISLNKDVKGEIIYDLDGSYLFTAQQCETPNPSHANWSVFFLFTSILLYIQIIIDLLKRQTSVLTNNLLYFATIVLSAIIYYIHVTFEFPSVLYTTSLFSPVYFGASDFFPNLGSLLLFSVLLFSKCYIFYKYVIPFPVVNKLRNNSVLFYSIIGLSVVLVFGFWHLQNYIVSLLVSNSASASINFKVTDIQFYDTVRILIISLFWLSVVVVLEKTVSVYYDKAGKKKLSLIVGLIVALFFLLRHDIIFSVSSLMFLLLMFMLIWVTRHKNYHAYTTFIWFVFLFSTFAVYVFYYYNYNKEREERKLLVENLSFRLVQEEDPLTEMLLKESEELIPADTFIHKILLQKKPELELLSKYFKNTYLKGYLERYDIQLIPCWPGGDVYINSDDKTYNCFNYFNHLLQESGTQVMGSKNYYFLKNQTGALSYFGVFTFFEGDDFQETKLFIELHSKPFFEGPGYPELLLSERERKLKEPLKNYSYAKYVNEQLTKRVGNYVYPIYLNHIIDEQEDFELFSYEDYSHISYKPHENVCVILSLPKVNVSMILVAFSIFFITFSIFGAAIILLTRLRKSRYAYYISVQERIQITFIGLMLVLLIVVASGSVWQTISRFEIKNNQVLSEKTKSVLMELEHKIGREDELTPDMYEYITELLKKFSSVFYSDINMFGTDGRLIATSRPELFDKGLAGHLMNSRAYIELNQKGELEFIHSESIGNLDYLSAYVPFFNDDNKVLAYINMPYFIGTSELREEVSSLVIAIVNFYLIFLIGVIGLAVVVSRRITHPLMVVQSKLRQLSLSGKNEKIEYKGNDEVGQLVREYNRMVSELSDSADKLAKSEREMAWREMARQIAHEIKNPLTPMKLSIQYLERANQDQAPDFDKKLKRVSSTLINQIDKLSSIASEFSNFAKMPAAKRHKVNITEVLIQCVNLFDKSKEADILIKSEGLKDYYIYADKEQMISVFNNLLKNALQSIPKSRHGLITVEVNQSAKQIIIKFKDNGTGVSKEVQEKLFVPNFTTKTSGMGLGLAIVKNIVVNTKGKIWFETEIDKGSTFFVQFPKYEEI
jgi:signal transduction histidine kinase/Ca2+/Na+ antiporter